jgi:hypothetical protein
MIMSRILLSAALALAVLGTTAQAQAGEYGYRHRRAHHHDYAPAPHYYGFFSFGYPEYYYRGPVGGHSYYWQHRAWPFVNGAAYNYPGFYNNQTFWERVQTQANYPVQY